MNAFSRVPFLILFVGVKYLLGRSGSATAGKSALDVLDETYARQEIGREEYLQRRDDLRKK